MQVYVCMYTYKYNEYVCKLSERRFEKKIVNHKSKCDQQKKKKILTPINYITYRVIYKVAKPVGT